MRIVLDTNVLVSARITRGTPPDLLVTGDRSGLLELKTVGRIPIVTPRQALERIRGGR